MRRAARSCRDANSNMGPCGPFPSLLHRHRPATPGRAHRQAGRPLDRPAPGHTGPPPRPPTPPRHRRRPHPGRGTSVPPYRAVDANWQLKGHVRLCGPFRPASPRSRRPPAAWPAAVGPPAVGWPPAPPRRRRPASPARRRAAGACHSRTPARVARLDQAIDEQRDGGGDCQRPGHVHGVRFRGFGRTPLGPGATLNQPTPSRRRPPRLAA